MPAIIIFILISFYHFSVLTAQTKSDSLANAMQYESSEVNRLHATALLAGELIPAYMDSARTLLEQSYKLVYMNDFPLGQAAWLNMSGNYNWFTGRRDSSMVNYRKTLSLEGEDLLRLKSAAAVNLGTLHNQRGEADSVWYYLDMASEKFQILGDEAGLAHVNSTLSVFHSQRNNYELALRHRLESMMYYESVQDTVALVHGSNSIGNIYKHLSDFPKALEYFQMGLELSKGFRHRGIVASLYNNLTTVYLSGTFNPDSLFYYAYKGVEAGKKADSDEILFALYTNLGVGYRLIGDLDQSQVYFNQTKEHLRPTTNRFYVLGSKVEHASLYLDKGQLNPAQQLLHEALEMAGEMGALRWEREAHMGLFRLDSLQGNYLTAIEHLHKANQLRDSIWQKERADRLAELNIIYETDKREAERIMLLETAGLQDQIISNQRNLVYISLTAVGLFIVLLVNLWYSRKKIKQKNKMLENLHETILKNQFEITRKNEQLNEQTNELVKLNQTKDKFISIIAHDLKGPFNALLGLTDMLSTEFSSMSDEKKKEIITSLNKTSQNTYALLVNLLEWSSVQKNDVLYKPQVINTREIADEAIGILEYNIRTKKHAIGNQIPDDVTVYADRQMLTSVFTNLINNAVKFTAEGGKIIIDGRSENNHCKICVRDSGIGIPASRIDQLFDLGSSFKRTGTEKELGTGLGLIIVKEFVTLMGGEIRVASEENKGSEFCITLPLYKK